MTTNNREDKGRVGQGGEGVGVDAETGKLTQAGLEAQRALDSFLGRAPAGGGRLPAGDGKRRKSKRAGSGGLPPFVRRLLRMFVCFRAFQIFPLLALCFIGAGGRSRYRGKGRRNGRAPRRGGGGGGRGIGRG